MKSSSRFPAFLLVVVLAGCGSTPVEEVSWFLLRTDPPREVVTNLSVTPVVGIGVVRIASYLAGDGIVYEEADGRIRSARQHRWSEPLDDSLRLIVSDRASAALGRPLLTYAEGPGVDYTVDLFVEEWHGSDAGDVRLVARWRITSDDGSAATRRFRFSDSVRRSEPGYPALVQAHLELGERFADAVARTLEPIDAVTP